MRERDGRRAHGRDHPDRPDEGRDVLHQGLHAGVHHASVERKSRTAGAGDDTLDVSYLRVTVDTTAGRRSFDTDHEHPGLDEARALVTGLIGHR
jgi:hypothetical protein